MTYATAENLVDQKHTSKHINDRRASMLVFHSMALPTQDALDIVLGQSEYEVSVHYAITPDGTVHQGADEGQRAWHAGASCWRGITDINSLSIGIELIVNDPDNRFDTTPFTEAQLAKAVALSQDITARHKIHPSMIVGHRDIAPDRKPDPGKLFPWQKFSENSVGIWPKIEADLDQETLDAPLNQNDITLFLLQLERYGYGVTTYGPDAVIAAYQTRFTPDRLTEPSMGKIGEDITTAPLLVSDLLRAEALAACVYA